MSVRQYIGARYIPLFIGPWDSTNEYEPLSVVTFQGSSYISRQYVPNGIAITNTDYWFLWSNYNSQIEAYRQDVLNVQNSLDDIQSEIDSLPDASDIATIQGDIDTLQSDVANKANTSDLGTAAYRNVTTTLNSTSNDLPTAATVYNAIESHTSTGNDFMVVFGDSWVDYTNAGRANFMPLVLDALNIDSADCAIYGVGGASFAYEPNNPEHTIGNQVTTALNELNNDQINRTKYVLIVGGVNDFHVEVGDDYYNAIDAMIENCLSSFPNATVLLAPNNCAPSYAGGAGGNITKSFRVFRAAFNLYQKYSFGNPRVRVCPMSSIFWIFSNFTAAECMTSDLLHLNSTNGIRLFADQILNGLGMKEVIDTYNYTMATASSGSSTVNTKIVFKFGQVPNIQGRIRSKAAADTTGNDHIFYLNTKASELLYYLIYFADATGAVPSSQRVLYRLVWTPSFTFKFVQLRMPANATGVSVMGELVINTDSVNTTYYFG